MTWTTLDNPKRTKLGGLKKEEERKTERQRLERKKNIKKERKKERKEWKSNALRATVKGRNRQKRKRHRS